MPVFCLFREIEHESTHLLGIYVNRSGAEKEMKRLEKENHYCDVHFEIEEHRLR